MEKLEILLKKCKCGVHLTVNNHRDYYETAEQRLEKLKDLECPPDIEDEVRAKMIKTNTVIELQFYPNTPIGSYEIYHYDMDKCLDEALGCLVI